jgi:hypothetical protein
MKFWSQLFGTEDRRICSRCTLPIQRTHRWQSTHHRFLWIHWTTEAHRDCKHPEMSPSAPRTKRLHGEVPLPFPEPQFTLKPIPGREFADMFGPSEQELARSIYEDGKVN